MTDTQPDDQVMLDWLASRDAACPVCACNLRGLTSNNSN